MYDDLGKVVLSERCLLHRVACDCLGGRGKVGARLFGEEVRVFYIGSESWYVSLVGEVREMFRKHLG